MKMNFQNQNTGSAKSLDSSGQIMNLAHSINVVCRMQNQSIDRLRLHHALTTYQDILDSTDDTNWKSQLQSVCLESGIDMVEFQDSPDPARLPSIGWLPDLGWVVIRAQTPSGSWLIESNGHLSQRDPMEPLSVARFIFTSSEADKRKGTVYRIFEKTFLGHKKIFIEGAVAGVFINLLALATSLYSMQVYDRVIPTQGYSTLFVLTLGVALSIFFELMLKVIRSYLLEDAVVNIDSQLSRDIFSRLLNVRLDQMPSSVGTLSSQLRGYETIRAFLSSTTFYVLVDVPFGIFFILLIGLIGNFWVALVPLFFLCLSIAMGVVMRKKIEYHASKATAATNLKTGLLVEAIEGVETIKAGGGGWAILSRWIDVVEDSSKHELMNRSISEKSGYVAAVLQQASYIGLVAAGAYFAAEGNLTMGSLIACSILSGRALGPIAQIPGLMVQRAHAKAALVGLEKVFALETDNHEVERPLAPDNVFGNYDLERVRFSYPSSPQALSIAKLQIRHGEKIGVIGPIGSGKSTLLRLLSGMYQAGEGRILLDGLDIDQISRPLLAQKIGYLQQEHRLFSGTLRQNLLIGTPDPGDEVIRNAAAKTGLLTAINHHPKGIDLPISEGGKGLSGGQRQLVAMTRLVLSNPSVWLLDEPTASMDEQTEARCIKTLLESMKPDDTMVLVTHKTNLLSLVNRLIVISNHQVLIDGPRDEVIEKLQDLIKRTQNLAKPPEAKDAS